MRWIRDYIVFEGDFPNRESAREFEQMYSKKEQVCIFALIKMMLFSNMLGNTVIKDAYEDGAACRI